MDRDKRRLLHQKSQQPTFGVGVPDKNAGNDGDVSYRQVEGSGTVQYVKRNGEWVAVGASTGRLPQSRNVVRTTIESTASSATGNYLPLDGSKAMTGNLDIGSNNIVNVTDLDVDGHTTLDQVTIDTTDGNFLASGNNDITLAVEGDDNFQLLNLIAGKSDYTKFGKIAIKNYNTTSGVYDGIHLMTSANDQPSVFNNIKIECIDVGDKGSEYGVDIRSQNKVRIRAEDNNASPTSAPTGILIRATDHIDIKAGTANVTPTPDAGNKRVKIHDLCEIEKLYRQSGAQINCSDHSIVFDQLDTPKLMRAQTYTVRDSSLPRTNTMDIVSAAADDNIAGTVWKVTLQWDHTSSNNNLQIWYCFASSDDQLDVVKDVESLYHSNAGGSLSWSSDYGIQWTNNHVLATGSTADVRASALRLQSGNDF